MSDLTRRAKGEAGLFEFMCQRADCDLNGQWQGGDSESVYFDILCVVCQRPVSKSRLRKVGSA